MRPRNVRRSCLLLPLLVLAGPCYAKGCLFHPSQGAPQRVSFGLIAVPADAKPGTVLAERTATPRLSYDIRCLFATRTSAMNLFQTPSAIGNGVYETNVPGVGIRVSFDYGGGTYYPAPESAYMGWIFQSRLNGAKVELVVTGPITDGGELRTGTLAGAGYDGRVQAMVDLVDARIKPQEAMCPFLAPRSWVKVHGSMHADGPDFAATAGASYAAVVFKVRQDAAVRRGRQARWIDEPEASDALLQHMDVVPLFDVPSVDDAIDPRGLRRYYRVALPADRQGDWKYLNRVLGSLTRRDDVELAYPELAPASPAAAYARSGRSMKGLPSGYLPDHFFRQFYLYPADARNGVYMLGGVDAHFAARLAGGQGEGVTIVTMEPGAWDPSHPDLPTSVRNIGDYRIDHANTATAGILAGIDNGFGIRGIANKASLAHASPDVSNFAELRNYLKAGDVLVLAFAAASGPVAGCATGCMLPMEYMPAWFDAIKDLTDRGVVVVESAGDSGIDLGHPDLGGTFDRTRRDSGAILVAGLCAMDGRRSASSNHGARIDSSSWSCGDVFTTASNLRHPDGAELDGYTDRHAGTPAAGAIVAGAAASLLGYARTKGLGLPATGVRSLLTTSGTPLLGGDSSTAATQPDLMRAFMDVDDCASSLRN
ncbi:S8 family serine peptidase [Luteibacter sp. NPDC031894]|uniref:S8 family serine peptidase n=1 Tax=Luteibacter sp. NPDC031894 TaxID=3390572 RepID=UPI003CFE107C